MEFYDKIDSATAYRYYKTAIAGKEKMSGAGNVQAIQELITQEENRQAEIARTQLAYQNKLKQRGLIIGLVVFLLIAFILYRNNTRQKTANKMLHQQKEEIQNTLLQLKSTQAQLIQSEKMASLGELTAGIAMKFKIR